MQTRRLVSPGVFIFLTVIAVLQGCEDQPVEVVVNPTIESLFVINDSGMVTLGWTGLETGIPDEIDVHRSSQVDFVPSSSTLIGTVSGTTARFEDTQLTNGQMYYYRIVPVDIVDDRPYPGTPTGVGIGRPLDYAQVTTISYDAHIQPIFNSSCAVNACHIGPATTSFSQLPRTTHNPQFSLRTWDDIFYGRRKTRSSFRTGH